MKIRRETWNRLLKHPCGQFAVVTVLMLILFALVGLGVSFFLNVLFGDDWMVF
ncbi:MULTISPECIES: hypothetical protein [unclassified Streptomyces]|uniref:hypothetical protein n=1 Tax=unclassified Streptomyces TaxID=2593676 RepID=UPI002E2A9A85|nr:hypothetical protein [Streptomyces sp. NBC_01439]